jgi:hypothetical protein
LENKEVLNSLKTIVFVKKFFFQFQYPKNHCFPNLPDSLKKGEKGQSSLFDLCSCKEEKDSANVCALFFSENRNQNLPRMKNKRNQFVLDPF